jgi:hypothetical protein
MTLEERPLLEITARSLLKLEKDILGRVAGIEAVLHALFVTEGNTALRLGTAKNSSRPARDERQAVAFPELVPRENSR